MPQKHRPPLSQSIQFIVGFVIPTVVLLTLSDESKLGPLLAMFVALAPPVVLELYSLSTRRKPSLISLFAIIGILLIGAISLLGLSEEWLGVRRAGIYIIGTVLVVGVLRFRRTLVDTTLERLIDMQAVHKAASKKGTEVQIARRITRTGYFFAVVLLLIGLWSYILTIIVITAPTGSSEFNAEYARLRVLSLPFVTLPFLAGMVGSLLYLVAGFEKHTGLELEGLLKKKR